MMRLILKGVILAGLSLLSPQWGMGPGPGTPHATGGLNPCAISAWPMNEGSGSTFHDVSGNSNTATMAIAPGWQTNAGFPGTTVLWGGGAAGPRSGNGTLTNFDGTTPFSLSAWEKTTGTDRIILSAISVSISNYRGWELGMVSGRVSFLLINDNGGNRISVEGGSAADGNVHYVVVTYDGSRNASGVKIYVDGSLQTPTVVNNALTATTANGQGPIIASRGDTTLPFIGVIAFTEIYNCVLTPTQIATYSAAGPGIY